jgi:hypothetical protein
MSPLLPASTTWEPLRTLRFIQQVGSAVECRESRSALDDVNESDMAVDETSPGRPPVLDEALHGVAEALRSDGFSLAWTADPQRRVSFLISGDEAACAECLVPEPVLAAMLGQALEGTGFTLGELQAPVLP